MKKKAISFISLILVLCLVLGAVSCNKKVEQEEPKEDTYSGTVLMNGFETTADMYKVRQHTYVKNDKWTGYSAKGKLQIVDKDDFIPVEREYKGEDVHKAEDMSPRQGQGALYINYTSEIAESGGFTQLIARFANSDLKDIPVEKLGGISVDIYNDNDSERKVTLSLVKTDLGIVSFNENAVTLAPYSWTKCEVDLNPAIVEYFQDDVVGLSIEFDKKSDCVYYLDNLCLSFSQNYTDEIREFVKLVKALEEDIDAKVANSTVTLESKEDLGSLFERYLALPKEYQAIVGNYTKLDDAIHKYLSLVYNEELTTTGEVSLLRFDEIFGLAQIEDGVGCGASYTTEVHAPSEEGSTCIEFDGTMDWAELFVNPNVAAYDEVRIWVKNDSEFARVLQLNWKTLAATGGTAYDENGEEIKNALTNVDYNNNIVTQGGWVQLVWRSQIDLTSFNFSSYDTKMRQTVKCEGKLYIGKVLASSTAAGLIKRIDAIEEKEDYTEKELLEIFDLYYQTMNLSKEQKTVLGLERAEKIERLYKKNAAKIISVKIKGLKVKDEYTAAEISEINGIKALYDELSEAERKSISGSALSSVLNKIADYNKNGTYMDVTAYDSTYEEKLSYSVKEAYEGAGSSVKYASQIKDGNHISVRLPKPIENAKRLKIAVKNISNKNIAFWPKVSDLQGGKWLEPINHGVIITNEEGWTELVYEIDGLTIDSLLATYGPWENGNLSFYIGKIEIVDDLSIEVKSEISKLSSLFEQDEFTASEIRKIQDVKNMYDGLSAADKKKINAEKLEEALRKLSYYDKSGANRNVLAYDTRYEDILSYSVKEIYSGENFSTKISTNITDKDAITVSLPENITGKKLTITLKNTSGNDIAFWPKLTDQQGGTWLVPTNRSSQPIIKADEGWVELTYDIAGKTIDGWVATYGPWENGTLGIYIGKIEVTDSYLSDVKKALDGISGLLDKDEFTISEIEQIRNVKSMYENSLSAAEKKKLDVTKLDAAIKKIEKSDTDDANMNIARYDDSYKDMLFYSVKEKVAGADFSLKLDREVGAGETYLSLPEPIFGAKTLTITVKNGSDADIAFWPKLTEAQGSTWLNPTNHGGQPIIKAEEGWVELTYDIGKMTIDALVATLGPWQSGDLKLYIGKMEIVTTYLPVVKEAIDSISDILNKDEFTADDIGQIRSVKEMYDSKLTDDEKRTLNATNLLTAVDKIQYCAVGGMNMDVTKYDSSYANMLYYSVKEKAEGGNFSLKLDKEMGAGESYFQLPEVISGSKKLTITVKNTSDKAVAFWPYAKEQGGAWLNPTNHSGQPVINAEEGWVELTYDVAGKNIDTLVLTYGPWESGQLEFYIGGIETSDDVGPALKQLKLTGVTGSTYSETADGIKVDFNASAPWCDIDFTAVEANKEIHIFLKNDSDCRRIVQLNWVGASKVLDANGVDITASVVSGGNTILPANSGWLEVVYPATSASQLNCCSLQGETGGVAINSVGTVYIKGYYTE